MVMDKTSRWIFYVAFFFLFGIMGSLPSWAVYQVGDSVSNFTLQNWNGQWISLFDYSDRIVLLDFWYDG
jgi:hypothetical protein